MHHRDALDLHITAVLDVDGVIAATETHHALCSRGGDGIPWEERGSEDPSAADCDVAGVARAYNSEHHRAICKIERLVRPQLKPAGSFINRPAAAAGQA